MKKTICKCVYDTENAVQIKKVTSGQLGDADGYEETLYQTPTGSYFLYVNGGEQSLYPSEDIKRLSKAKAEEWLAKNN